MKPININLSPNTEADDVSLAFRALFQPYRYNDIRPVENLEAQFKTFFQEEAIAFRSGRSALYAAIQSLELKAGDEVLLQSFTCVAVPNAVIWAGGTPIYVDINDDFNVSVTDLEKKISNNAKAIIVQHTFGFSAELDTIMKLAKDRNLMVIEDCAHALGADFRGQKLGSFGDMSIFSFGRDKVISSVFGGMLIVKNPELAQKVKALRDQSPLPSHIWTARQLWHPILMNWLVLPTYTMGVGKAILELSKRLGFISKAVYKSERLGKKERSVLGKMPGALARLALHQLQKLDRFNAHRLQIARIYDEELKGLQGGDFILPQSDSNSKHIYLRYVVKTSATRELIQAARNKNIILDDWYNPSIAPVGVENAAIGYVSQSCPNAEKISQLSLNLPTNINTSAEDAKRIVEFIKHALHH